MRYRPFGRSGVVTSALALSLGDDAARRGPEALRTLIFTALEAGINAYHLSATDPEVLRIAGETFSTVERRLLYISMRLGVARGRVGLTRDFSPESLTGGLDAALHGLRMGHVDAVILDGPANDELPRASLEALRAQRAAGRVNLLGVAGTDDTMDAYVSSNAFDLLVTPYHLRSGWKERNRLKSAVELDMGVMAFDWFPAEFATARKTDQASGVRRGLFGGKPVDAHPLAGVGGYSFLHQTKNWTAEELCLAYALTEPALSTVLVETHDPAHLTSLAAVPDRDMPPGLGAQIEMARFGPATSAAAG